MGCACLPVLVPTLFGVYLLSAAVSVRTGSCKDGEVRSLIRTAFCCCV